MSLSPTKARVGDQLNLTVRVSIRQRIRSLGGYGFSFGMSRPNYDLQLPANLKQDFVVVSSTPFQVNNIVGNQQSFRADYTYAISPRRAGRILLPPAKVVFKGRTYTSQPVVVNVGATPAPPPSLPGQTPNLTGDEDLFVHAVADRLKAYVGQQITITWYLYYKSPVARRAAIVSRPTTDSFFSEEIPLGTPSSTHTTIKGQVFTVTPVLRLALFPLKAGKLKVGGLGIEAYLDYYQKVLRSSAAVTLDVRDLPRKNVPPGFYPRNVGQFKVTAEVGQHTIDARSATSLKVTVSGTGFIGGLKVDRIQKIPGFKVRFAGQKTEPGGGAILGGRRIHEYVLIPTKVGSLKIPPVCFPHFDPTQGRYVTTACSAPITVTVTGKLLSGAGIGLASHENELRRRLKPILQGSHLRSRSTWRLHRTRWLLWLLLLLPPFGLGVGVLIRLIRSMDTDTEASRRRRARSHARRRLRLASSYLKESDRVAFFAEISSVIQELLSARLGARVQGLTGAELQQLLESSGMSEDLRERILKDLEVCDFARFAPAAAEETEMHDVLARTRKLIGELERAPLEPPPGLNGDQAAEAA